MVKKVALNGQIWRVGKATQKSVKEQMNIEIGNEVCVIDCMGGYGLITVRDIKTGVKFDVGLNNLGKRIR